MAAQAPSSFTPQPPPSLPHDPSLSATLINYLTQFSLWCRNGFGAKLNANQALPGILLQANDAPSGQTPPTFILQVNSAGAVVVTPVAIATGTFPP